MIGLILGTSEGKKIVSLLNEFTDDIFISTATHYGGQLLEKYKYKKLNTRPLDLEGIIKVIEDNEINILVDASHPYALEVTENAMEACRVCNIEYIRYERPSVSSKYKEYEKLIEVEEYEDIYEKLKNVEGNILNTTGSRNLKKILNLNLTNRIIHRVLPSLKVMNECFKAGIDIEDVIAIKGPISYELNCSFIREYNAKVIMMKDSGVQGGTEEKLKAAVDLGIYAVIIKRKTIKYDNVFCNEEDIVFHVKENI
ncbi:cobalt-precorrin-6A reductase [Haloimpatiens sp. FM7330]|uniref:cobalt-precorrin-6A reductase n=1 Tax=Haloimpatiens sp. FM7330 TaxID=3298610 RepID=UPI003641F56F